MTMITPELEPIPNLYVFVKKFGPNGFNVHHSPLHDVYIYGYATDLVAVPIHGPFGSKEGCVVSPVAGAGSITE